MNRPVLKTSPFHPLTLLPVLHLHQMSQTQVSQIPCLLTLLLQQVINTLDKHLDNKKTTLDT